MVRISPTCPASWVRTDDLATTELTCCKTVAHDPPHLDINTGEEWSE